MKRIAIISFILISSPFLTAQQHAGSEATSEYRYLIDMPAAGVLDKGFVSLSSYFMPDGLVIGNLDVGVFNNVCFGISYGGVNVVGSGDVEWYNQAGVNLRVKVFEETVSLPSFTLGFDSQGKGYYFNDDERYAIKSPGFFLASSKNFEFLGYLGLHGTLNYSLEDRDGDNFVNLMIGVEKTVGKVISVIADYNFAFNDNTTGYYGNGGGYLNIGIRWSVAPGFTVGLDFRDLISNRRWNPHAADRALELQYVRHIL